MLFCNILIVNEVLLVDTGAVAEVPVTAIEPTHIKGIIHPSKATPKNQHVIIVKVHII